MTQDLRVETAEKDLGLSSFGRRWEMLKNAHATLRLPRDRRRARKASANGQIPSFADVKAYAMFIGYPRSCHSLVGALLDAHPEIVMAHEEDALRYVDAGISRQELFYLLADNARRMADDGREWTGYSYAVPGQSQGTASVARVIGDKKGAQSIRRIICDPGLLDRLRLLVGVPLRLIHVVRNPYDNVATMAYRDSGADDAQVSARQLQRASNRYFSMHDGVLDVIAASNPAEVLTIHADDLAAEPRPSIQALCRFLAVECDDDYLEACAEKVAPTLNASRFRFAWPESLRSAMARRIARDPLLARYQFGSENES